MTWTGSAYDAAGKRNSSKTHSIAARMDATGVSDRVAQQPGEQEQR